MKTNSKYSHLSRKDINSMTKITMILLFFTVISSYIVWHRVTSYNVDPWLCALNIMIMYSLSVLKTPNCIIISAITWNLFITTLEGVVMIVITEIIMIFSVVSQHTLLILYSPLVILPIMHCNLLAKLGVAPKEEKAIIKTASTVKEYPILLSGITILALITYEVFIVTNSIIIAILCSIIVVVAYSIAINKYYLNCLKKAGWVLKII